MKKAIAISIGLVAAHLLLKHLRKQPPKIVMVKKLPFNYNAITVPPFGIFSTSNEVALIEHERVHWQQYQRMGLLPYYINYAIGSAQGYDANPMEMEARANETDYCRANYTACVRSGQAKTIANPRFRL